MGENVKISNAFPNKFIRSENLSCQVFAFELLIWKETIKPIKMVLQWLFKKIPSSNILNEVGLSLVTAV
jgi:hypothetical protein